MSDTINARPAAAPITPEAPTTRGVNVLKWSLGCVGVGMLLFTGTVMLALIVMPIAFRSLSSEQQYQVMKHAPFMAAFVPTRAYAPDTLPTVSSVNNGAAMALLVIVPTGTPTSLPTHTNTPTQQAPVMTSVLVTSTPIGAAANIVPSATLRPSPTSLPTDLPTDQPTATDLPIPSVYHLTGIKRVAQGWNDCGPANTMQVLQYYGWSGTQEEAVKALKPNYEDRNVSPWEIVRFINDHTGVRSLSRVAGDLTLIKRLVAAKFAVIMETGYIVAGEGPAGHYLTVLGYDDNQHILFGGDSNLGFGVDGLGQHEDYDDLDARWQQFNRQYIVTYPRERESELAALLGQDADPQYNKQHALAVAQKEAAAKPDNPFAWFNLGSSLDLLGEYQKATTAFDKSRNTGTQLPWRMLWYQFTPYDAYYNAGDYNNVLALVQVTLGTTQYVEESWYWRGMVEAAKNQNDLAIKDFNAVLAFNPGFSAAADALARVKAGNFIPPVSPDAAK